MIDKDLYSHPYGFSSPLWHPTFGIPTAHRMRQREETSLLCGIGIWQRVYEWLGMAGFPLDQPGSTWDQGPPSKLGRPRWLSWPGWFTVVLLCFLLYLYPDRVMIFPDGPVRLICINELFGTYVHCLHSRTHLYGVRIIFLHISGMGFCIILVRHGRGSNPGPSAYKPDALTTILCLHGG